MSFFVDLVDKRNYRRKPYKDITVIKANTYNVDSMSREMIYIATFNCTREIHEENHCSNL